MRWLADKAAAAYTNTGWHTDAHLPYDGQQLEVVQFHFYILQAQTLAPLLTLLCSVAHHFELAQEGVEDAEGERCEGAVLVGVSARGDGALHYVDHAFAQGGLRQHRHDAQVTRKRANTPGLNRNSTGIRSS